MMVLVLFLMSCVPFFVLPLSTGGMQPSTSPKSVALVGFMLALIMVNVSGLLLGSCYTMHMGCILCVSFILWVFSLVVLFSNIGFGCLVSHFLPAGLEGAFMFIMPILEAVSWAVRPLTLGVRLGVNISSGHVLFAMLLFFSSTMSFIVMLGVLSVLLLECLVCYLQGYIYVSLLVLYSS